MKKEERISSDDSNESNKSNFHFDLLAFRNFCMHDTCHLSFVMVSINKETSIRCRICDYIIVTKFLLKA